MVRDCADEAPRGARGRHKERSPPLAPSPEMLAPWELQPLARPEAALAQALALLAGEDWYVRTAACAAGVGAVLLGNLMKQTTPSKTARSMASDVGEEKKRVVFGPSLE